MRRIKRIPFRRDVEELFGRYATALDNQNANVTFVEMWSILEKLTNTVGGPAYYETIRRVVSTYCANERGIAKEILQSLRLFRNMYVHSARLPHYSDQVAYLMKYFLDPMLMKLTSNVQNARRISDFGDFYALPADEKELEEQIRVRSR